MICTYCGRGTHTAAGCTVRPRIRQWRAATARREAGRGALVSALLAATLALAACSSTPPVPPSQLAPAPAELMAPPEPLPPIPACEGERPCRLAFYAADTQVCTGTAERLVGLQRWVRAGYGRS